MAPYSSAIFRSVSRIKSVNYVVIETHSTSEERRSSYAKISLREPWVDLLSWLQMDAESVVGVEPRMGG